MVRQAMVRQARQLKVRLQCSVEVQCIINKIRCLWSLCVGGGARSGEEQCRNRGLCLSAVHIIHVIVLYIYTFLFDYQDFNTNDVASLAITTLPLSN